MNFDRFSNSLGEEYNLFKKAVPHHDEFQDKIGMLIKKYSSQLEDKEINVVEGGSGTGITTLRILEADPRIKIIGIDNEEKTLKQTEKFLANYRERIIFQKEDLLDALRKRPSQSANIFASAWVIHNLPEEYRETLFKEISRVLKPGGFFINGDKYALNDEPSHSEELKGQLKNFNVFAEIGRMDLKEEWTKHYLEDEKIRFTESEQAEILKKTGFTEINIPYRKGLEAIFTAIRST